MSLTYDRSATTEDSSSDDKPKSDFADLPHVPKDTLVLVEVARCEIRKVEGPSTKWKKYDQEVVFAFKDVEGKWNKRWFWLDAEATLNGKSFLRKHIESITGIKPLPDGFEFIPEEMIGEQCYIRMGTYFSDAKQKIMNDIDDIINLHDAPKSTAEMFGTESLTYNDNEEPF